MGNTSWKTNRVKSMSVGLSVDMIASIKKMVEKKQYPSVSEFVRRACRNQLAQEALVEQYMEQLFHPPEMVDVDEFISVGVDYIGRPHVKTKAIL